MQVQRQFFYHDILQFQESLLKKSWELEKTFSIPKAGVSVQ